MTEQQITIIRSVGGITFDATFEERHTSELEVTSEPVETGVEVSDHAFMKPLRVTISAGVSDVQLTERVDDPFTGDRRSKAAFDLIQKLQSDREPVDIQTGLKLYSNMMCISIQSNQTKDNPQALFFEADFREIITVSTQTITYPPRKSGATAHQADPTKQKGEQQGSQQDAKRGSLLYKLGSLLGGGSER